MPEIPSFLNKIDFYGKLLPGFVVMVMYFLLFKDSSRILGSLAVGDLGVSVFFLITGVASGYSLFQAERLLRNSLRYIHALHPTSKKKIEDYKTRFVQARLKCNPDQRLEFDDVISQYDFNASLCLGAWGLAVLALVSSQSGTVAALLLGIGLFFLIGAWESTKGIHKYVDAILAQNP